jgi:hypothetical protein
VHPSIAHHQVNPWESRYRLRIEFRVTASHNHQRVRLTAVGLADHQPRTAIAQMGNCAGINNIDIGGFIKFALNKASSTHLFANGFAIGLINLAAQRSDCKCSFFAHGLYRFRI